MTTLDFHTGVLIILTPAGELAGTGFVVSASGMIVTCAHVVSRNPPPAFPECISSIYNLKS